MLEALPVGLAIEFDYLKFGTNLEHSAHDFRLAAISRPRSHGSSLACVAVFRLFVWVRGRER